uniref:Uncharacterized protein n=1 Tax=Oryza rufipogon TaxID=4529 RepID=A0A0E0NCA3_ORYRU
MDVGRRETEGCAALLLCCSAARVLEAEALKYIRRRCTGHEPPAVAPATSGGAGKQQKKAVEKLTAAGSTESSLTNGCSNNAGQDPATTLYRPYVNFDNEDKSSHA